MDRLEEIFQRQKEFCESLAPIYRRNGFPDGTIPFELNGRHDQEQFRLLAWRITEEIIETIENYNEFVRHNGFWDSAHVPISFKEEIADSFHFLVELCLVLGITPEELLSQEFGREKDADLLGRAFNLCGYALSHSISQRWLFVIHKLGKAMFLLRQRPWRTDDRRTDRTLLVGAIGATFLTFVSACKRSGIDANDLYQAYFRKSKINNERTAQQKL